MRYLAEHRYPAPGGAAGRNRAGQPHAGAGRAGAGARSAEQPPACCDWRAAVPQERILITGAKRGVITFANCCMPIPGDDIMGYHTAGKGIVVHRLDCPNVAEYRKSPERWVPIGWDREVIRRFRRRVAWSRSTTGPACWRRSPRRSRRAESNIDRVEYLERDTNVAAIRFAIEVRDRKHLADVIRRMRRLGVVHGVQRL